VPPSSGTDQAKKNNKIRHNVLWGGFLLSAILWGIGAIVSWQNYQNATKQAEISMQNLGTRLAHNTSSSIKNVDLSLVRTASQFAKNWDRLIKDPFQIHEFITTAFTDQQQLQSVLLIGVGGKTLYSHRFVTDHNEPTNNENFMVHMLLDSAKRLYIGTMYS